MKTQPTETAATAPPEKTVVSLVPKGPVRRAALQILVNEFRLADGKVKGIKSGVARVRLSRRAGQIAIWENKAAGDMTVVITADGYSECNRVAGISVVTPKLVVVPGVGTQANPYNVLDESTGCFRASYIRKIALARSPLGNMCIVDRTLLYSLNAYLIEDLAQTSKWHPAAVMLGMKNVTPADIIVEIAKDSDKVKPADVERVKQKYLRGVWAFFQIEASTGLGYWVDHSAEAVRALFLNYVQGQKFGDRKADSVATRNVLRHHPLMPQMKISFGETHETFADRPPNADAKWKPESLDRVADVPVYFHADLDDEDRDRALEEYDRGIRTAAVSVDAEAQAEQASREDDQAGSDEEKPTQPPPDERPADAPRVAESPAYRDPPPQPKPDQNGALLARIAEGEKIAGPDLTKQVLKDHPVLATAEGRRSASELDLRAYLDGLRALIEWRDSMPKTTKSAKR